MPMVIYNTFKKLGFDVFTIHINNRKILNGFFENLHLNNSGEILRIVDKLDKIGIDKVKQYLFEIGVSDTAINDIINFILIAGSNNEKISALKKLNIDNDNFKLGIHELEDVINGIRLFGIPENNFIIDLTIARGLDYYTGTVYETFLDNYKQLGSVCSGGRYENLAEFYTDKKLPGVGISIGLTRLFYQLNELNAIRVSRESIAKVLVVSASSDIKPCLPIATAFRKAGINTELYLNNKKIKSKFKYADKLNIPFVVVIGEDEINNNLVTLKNMKTGKQCQITIEEAIKTLYTPI